MKRIQRKRVKGWKKPANTVNVARPSKFGNPFKVGDPGIESREKAVSAFKEWFETTKAGKELKKLAQRELKGKNLMCYCPLDGPCHADILLKAANEED